MDTIEGIAIEISDDQDAVLERSMHEFVRQMKDDVLQEGIMMFVDLMTEWRAEMVRFEEMKVYVDLQHSELFNEIEAAYQKDVPKE